MAAVGTMPLRMRWRTRVMWRKNKRLVEEVLLFGDLIDRMRAKIKRGPCSFQWTGAEPSLR
eukprot:5959694-Ditylum_brightwellii.AAC.1